MRNNSLLLAGDNSNGHSLFSDLNPTFLVDRAPIALQSASQIADCELARNVRVGVILSNLSPPFFSVETETIEICCGEISTALWK